MRVPFDTRMIVYRRIVSYEGTVSLVVPGCPLSCGECPYRALKDAKTGTLAGIASVARSIFEHNPTEIRLSGPEPITRAKELRPLVAYMEEQGMLDRVFLTLETCKLSLSDLQAMAKQDQDVAYILRRVDWLSLDGAPALPWSQVVSDFESIHADSSAIQ